jgi:hypothetical protein
MPRRNVALIAMLLAGGAWIGCSVDIHGRDPGDRRDAVLARAVKICEATSVSDKTDGRH